MISYEYETSRSYNYDGGRVKNDPVTTVYFEAADFANLPLNLHNGARAYCIDWKLLGEAEQAEIGDQLLIFAGTRKQWCPM